MINSGPDPTNFTLNLLTIPGLDCASLIHSSTDDDDISRQSSATVSCEIRDVWKQESLGIHPETTPLLVPNVASHDSAFFVIGRPQPYQPNKNGAIKLMQHLDSIQISNDYMLLSYRDALLTMFLIIVVVVRILKARQRCRVQSGSRLRKTILGRRRT